MNATSQPQVLVVDRATAVRDTLVGLLGVDGDGEVFTAADAASTVRQLHRHDVDLVIIELDLPDLDGIDLARLLGQFARPPAVAFVAADGDRAIEAFDVGAVDYLVRPVLAHRLAVTLSRVRPAGPPKLALAAPRPDRAPAARPAAVMATSLLGGGVDIPPSSVRWLEANRDFVRVNTGTGSRLLNISLGHLVAAWDTAGIVRIHRSYAVQVAAITEIRNTGRGYTVVVDGREFPVSRRAARLLRDRLFSGRLEPPRRAVVAA